MTTRDVSSVQEKNVARLLGGRRTANSGATLFSKADVIVDDCIVECKTKMQECSSFSVSLEWLKKLEHERQDMGAMLAALAISFDSGKSSFYIIDAQTMKYFLDLHHDAKEASDG